MPEPEPTSNTFTAVYLADSGQSYDDSKTDGLKATSRSSLLRRARFTCPHGSRLAQIVVESSGQPIWTKETGKPEHWNDELAARLFNE